MTSPKARSACMGLIAPVLIAFADGRVLVDELDGSLHTAVAALVTMFQTPGTQIPTARS